MKKTFEPWQHRLTGAELNELSTLAFKRANDIPFDEERYDELRNREVGRG